LDILTGQVSAWNLQLDGTDPSNLIITRSDEPTITVDNIEVGQFIYLLLNNQKIREVIDTVTSKAVLILGRFTPDRPSVLDALREELCRYAYLPIMVVQDGWRSSSGFAVTRGFLPAEPASPPRIVDRQRPYLPGTGITIGGSGNMWVMTSGGVWSYPQGRHDL
jgi:hypothetical protein